MLQILFIQLVLLDLLLDPLAHGFVCEVVLPVAYDALPDEAPAVPKRNGVETFIIMS